jgi:hypothetical protein
VYQCPPHEIPLLLAIFVSNTEETPMAQLFPAKPILLVDDETDVLRSYKITLRFNGISNFVLCSNSTLPQTV